MLDGSLNALPFLIFADNCIVPDFIFLIILFSNSFKSTRTEFKKRLIHALFTYTHNIVLKMSEVYA